MEFQFRVSRDGGMDFGERNRALFKHYLKSHAGVLCKITPILPESNKQRRFLEGAIIPLVTYYQEGMNHRNSEDRANVREWLKTEFNGHMVMIGGEAHKIPKSTKGSEALNRFVEEVVAWLIDNYAPPEQALNPASFKKYKAEIFPDPLQPDNYIDWLILEGVLK